MKDIRERDTRVRPSARAIHAPLSDLEPENSLRNDFASSPCVLEEKYQQPSNNEEKTHSGCLSCPNNPQRLSDRDV
jgi:hypothetical protein